MSICGTCKTCGGDTVDYVCSGCLCRENALLRRRCEIQARLIAALESYHGAFDVADAASMRFSKSKIDSSKAELAALDKEPRS